MKTEKSFNDPLFFNQIEELKTKTKNLKKAILLNKQESDNAVRVLEGQTKEKKNFNDFFKKLNKKVDPAKIILYLGSIDSVRILLSKNEFPIEKEFRLTGKVLETVNLIGLAVMSLGISIILIYYFS